MIYCTTSFKLFVGFLVETYSRSALNAVVNQLKSAIFPGLREASLGLHKPDETARCSCKRYCWAEDKSVM